VLTALLAGLTTTHAHAGINVWTTGVPSNFGAEDLAIDPSVPPTLYAASENIPGLVYKSVDGGATWTSNNNGLNGTPQEVVIDSHVPTTLYVGAVANGAGQQGGVYKSTDGGASWKLMNNGLPPESIGTLAIDFQTPSTASPRSCRG